MEGQWGGSSRRLLFSMCVYVRGSVWREEGWRAGGAGKVFDEQKQWSILCCPAWVER